MKPTGGRIFVRDIISSLSVEERAKRAGIIAIVNDSNRPKATMGQVVAIGNDPLIADYCKVGDVVYFGPLAGKKIVQEGHEVRILELPDIEATEDDPEVIARLVGSAVPVSED